MIADARRRLARAEYALGIWRELVDDYERQLDRLDDAQDFVARDSVQLARLADHYASIIELKVKASETVKQIELDVDAASLELKRLEDPHAYLEAIAERIHTGDPVYAVA